jgi:(p)ppGpp synthase/HD superfamily hydrolase
MTTTTQAHTCRHAWHAAPAALSEACPACSGDWRAEQVSPIAHGTRLERKIVALRYWFLGRNYLDAADMLETSREMTLGLRKDGVTPAVGHPVEVTLFTRTFDRTLISPQITYIVNLGHDLREDYGVTLEWLAERYGEEAARGIDSMTKKVGGVVRPPEEVYARQAEDPHGSIAKGADRIHNFQSMPGVFTLEKQELYIDEAETFIIPMLKRARRNFPAQEPAYEAMKFMLRSQIEMVRHIHAAARVPRSVATTA